MAENDAEIITFGCRLNLYESEVMKNHAKAAGLENAIIFNTCAVTKEAERQARQSIRKARRNNPDKKIIVTGCAAQITPQIYADMPEVDQVLGNIEKMEPRSFLPENDAPILVNDIMSVKETASHLLAGFDEKTRAYVQVQNGCDHRCTFCTIPYGRGNSRSVPMGVLVDQVRTYVQNGFKEVVLTGVDITSYGQDLPGSPTLGQMMRRLLAQVPDLKRLRLSSVDPQEIDTDVLRLLATEPRFMPHLHISLQAGDDLILKRMKRRHLRHHLLDFCKAARMARPDVVFGADIIAGFPTETEERFLNTLNIIQDCGLTYVHAFPYSPRPGTPAARMPQVERGVIKERAKRLREEAQAAETAYLKSLVNTTQEILVENAHMGRTQHFAPVTFVADLKQGTLQMLKITGYENGKLEGTVL